MLPNVLDNKPELYKNDKPIAICDDKCCRVDNGGCITRVL